jgi:MFS family permease
MSSQPSAPPSRARNWVIFFAVTLAVITYVDRVCISQAAPQMQQDLGLTKEQMGWAFTTFSLAYALFEIPGGWLGDKIGPRKVLMRVVAMWSLFTAATGWAWNMASLLVCRFLFGVGEAGCFPNLTKAFTLWLPVSERVRAQGIMWLSARWGGAFTPLLVGWMLAKDHLNLHYKWTFLLFGGVGVLWAACFYFWFRDNPRHHPAVNEAELKLIGNTADTEIGHGSVPWAKLVASRSVWLLWLQYFCMSFAWYFYITWMPTFIRETFPHFTDIQRALIGCVPLFFGGLGSLFAGLIATPVARWTGSIATSRRVMGCIGLCGAAVMLLASVWLRNSVAAENAAQSLIPIFSMLAVGLASFCNDLAMPGGWGACMDVGGKHTGSLSGSMNMMGNFGGAMPGFIVPMVLNLTNPPGAAAQSWNAVFYLFAIVYVIGGLSWIFLDPVTPLEQPARRE